MHQKALLSAKSKIKLHKVSIKVWTQKGVIASINTQAWKNTALQASKILVHDEIFLSKPVGEEICFPVCSSKHMAE